MHKTNSERTKAVGPVCQKFLTVCEHFSKSVVKNHLPDGVECE